MKKKYAIMTTVPNDGTAFLEKDGLFSGWLSDDTLYFDSEEEALTVLEKQLAANSENKSFWKASFKEDYLSIIPVFSKKFQYSPVS